MHNDHYPSILLVSFEYLEHFRRKDGVLSQSFLLGNERWDRVVMNE